MIDRKQIDDALREANQLLGQRRVWVRGFGLPDVIVESCRLEVRMNFDLDLEKESIEVAEMIWCHYTDSPFGVDRVWFDKKRFLSMKMEDEE